MAQEYEAGSTLGQIAQSHGTSPQTVRRRLVAHGVEIRDYRHGTREAASEAIRQKHGYDESTLRQLASEGLSAEEIGSRIGKTGEGVRRQMVRFGIPRLPAKARPEKNHFWSGGLTVDKHGYILQKMQGHPYASKAGYVRQHRLVVEEELGRHLPPDEVVDHRNEDKSDNRPANLRVFQKNSDHLRETLTGKRNLSRDDRAAQTRADVQRARLRVSAILAESGTGAGQ